MAQTKAESTSHTDTLEDVDVVDGLRRLADSLSTQPDEASQRLARALRVWIDMPAGHRFDMDAAMGMHPAWRSALPRIAQRQALIRLGQQQFPNASGRQRARNTVAFVAEYKRARWSTDRRMQRQPDGAAGEAFNILTLAPSIPSPNTLRKYMPGATTPPPAAPTYSPGSRQQEKPVAVMARIRNGLSSTEPAAVSVPKLDDDPRYAEASALLGAINGRVARLGRERDRLILEERYAGRPVAEINPDDFLWHRLVLLRQEPPITPSPATSTDAPTPAIDRAMRILEGTPIMPPPTFQERISEIDRQIAALGDAARDQQNIVHQLAGEISGRACASVRPRWEALQVELYDNSLKTAATLRSIRSLETEIVANGVTFRGDLLRMPFESMPAVSLGDPEDFNSAIATWGRVLKSWELL